MDEVDEFLGFCRVREEFVVEVFFRCFGELLVIGYLSNVDSRLVDD